jgi:uncharacterized membrane protein
MTVRSRLGPLWLPRGSVRAVLALSVVFVVSWLTVRDEPVPLAVSEALFTALAYYFATRGASRSKAAEPEPTGGGELNPLFLPRGTVRFLIVAAFIGLALWVLVEEGWGRLASATTLLLVLAFFTGQVVKHVIRWLRPPSERHEVTTFDHLKAAVGVGVAVGFVALFVSGAYHETPPAVYKGFLGFMIFYFGSR